MADELEAAPDLGKQMFPDETAEEAVARIVAANPQKHGVTFQERMARATELAKRMVAAGCDLSGLSADDALIVSVGGDPNEMLTGNKPRWTVDGNTIKDHLEGKEFGVIAVDAAVPTITLDDIERIKAEGPGAVLGAPDYTIDEAGNVKDHGRGQVYPARVGRFPAVLAEEGSEIRDQGGEEEVPQAPEVLPGQKVAQEGSSEAASGSEPARGEQDQAVDRSSKDGDSPAVADAQTGGGATLLKLELLSGAGVTDEYPSESRADDAGTMVRGECDHSFPEPIKAQTPCAHCGVTFETWANS